MPNQKYKFALLGASKVGLSLAWHLKIKGHIPQFVWNRSKAGLEQVQHYVKFAVSSTNFSDFTTTDLVIISVSDDAIAEVAGKLSNLEDDFKGAVIFHNSGYHSSDILKQLQDKNARIGSLHPVVSVPNVKRGIELIPETVFSCEGEAARELQIIANQIGKKGIILDKSQKQYIHLAAVFVNNYMTTLISALRQLLEEKGIESQDSAALLQKLSEQTASNWQKPIVDTLTGPLVRNDLETVKGHLKLLEKHPDLKELYSRFGLLTVNLLPAELNQIRQVLELDD